MSKSTYRPGTLDEVLEKMNQNGPEYRKVVDEIISACYKAGKINVPMEEIAALASLGWYMTQDAQLEALYHMILNPVGISDDAC